LRSLLPVVIGIVVLVLLGVLGVGAWLIFQSQRGSPTIQTSSAPATTPAVTTEPTSARPTTAAPSTAPAQVNVPPVDGLTERQAAARLVAAGLRVQVVKQVATAPPGTVLRTDPAAGTAVAPGSLVQLIVAAAPSHPSTTPSPSPSP
jgi:hypothetical protein